MTNPTRADRQRNAPIEIDSEHFRHLGHRLIDQISDFLASLPKRPVTTGEMPSSIRARLGPDEMPQAGQSIDELLARTANLLFDHSLFNGHPKFLGYITSSAAPIGALADLLAAAVNPNVGAWTLAPVASEIEKQTIQWIAEMIGYDRDCGGLLVSGGNMANFVGFLAARRAKAGEKIQTQGIADLDGKRLCVYASHETHTWIHKAADLFGIGTDHIRWVDTDQDLRMNTVRLRQMIESDLRADDLPFLVIGTAGSVSTGVIDPLADIAEICREYDLWFHADGAYGAFAAVLPDAPPELAGLKLADSIALDPHKWLYAPLEAGCALVKQKEKLHETFSYRPPYYKFDEIEGEETIIYNEFGPQNSRGFRALKVWLALQQAGRSGYVKMISDDIELAEVMFELARAHRELQAVTQSLSITTFRYVPERLQGHLTKLDDAYLNNLNTEILTRLQNGGEAFVSNAVVHGMYLLRACIVNFRTTVQDLHEIIDTIVRLGREVDGEMGQSC